MLTIGRAGCLYLSTGDKHVPGASLIEDVRHCNAINTILDKGRDIKLTDQNDDLHSRCRLTALLIRGPHGRVQSWGGWRDNGAGEQ